MSTNYVHGTMNWAKKGPTSQNALGRGKKVKTAIKYR